MSSREEIVERIRKLLSMTEEAGCTQSEAVQAALLAQKLVVENDVKDEELNGASGDAVVSVGSRACKRMRDWGKALSAEVAAAFRCKTLEGRPEWGGRYNLPFFIGHETDARAAQLVFDRLYAVGNRLAVKEGERVRAEWRAAAVEEGNPDWWVVEHGRRVGARGYNSFALGFLQGVRSELSKQTAALAVRVPSDVCEAFGEIRTSKRSLKLGRGVGGKSLERGRQAGSEAVRAGRLAPVA